MTYQTESLTISSPSMLDHKMFYVTQWQDFWGSSLKIKNLIFFKTSISDIPLSYLHL